MDDWDWELLHNSHQSPPQIDHQPSNPSLSSSSDEDDGKISGVFQSDYFSIKQSNESLSGPASEEGETDTSSDNPSWIDPSITVSGTRTRFSGSSDGSSVGTETSDLAGQNSLELVRSQHSSCEFHGGGDGGCGEGGGAGGGGEEEEERGRESEAKEVEEEKKEGVVWWRVPIEMVRYCVIRVSPVWSLSMLGAAIMGFMILRRRYLYKIKRKSLGLQLKVTIDDKKESQFMSRVARLNEAFSVVKRVPMIRPSLPAPGLTPWPVMSMR